MIVNRALAFVLKRFWQVVSKNADWIWIDEVLATEMVMAVALLPVAFCDLRLRTDAVVSATDASGHSGGVSMSTGLSERGVRALEFSAWQGNQRSSDDLALFSFFDGIGAV